MSCSVKYFQDTLDKLREGRGGIIMSIACGLKVTMKRIIGELDENSNMLSGRVSRYVLSRIKPITGGNRRLPLAGGKWKFEMRLRFFPNPRRHT